MLYELLGAQTALTAEGKVAVQPLDPETARAIVALALSSLFVTKTAKNFGLLNGKKPVIRVKKAGECSSPDVYSRVL